MYYYHKTAISRERTWRVARSKMRGYDPAHIGKVLKCHTSSFMEAGGRKRNGCSSCICWGGVWQMCGPG